MSETILGKKNSFAFHPNEIGLLETHDLWLHSTDLRSLLSDSSQPIVDHGNSKRFSDLYLRYITMHLDTHWILMIYSTYLIVSEYAKQYGSLMLQDVAAEFLLTLQMVLAGVPHDWQPVHSLDLGAVVIVDRVCSGIPRWRAGNVRQHDDGNQQLLLNFLYFCTALVKTPGDPLTLRSVASMEIA